MHNYCPNYGGRTDRNPQYGELGLCPFNLTGGVEISRCVALRACNMLLAREPGAVRGW